MTVGRPGRSASSEVWGEKLVAKIGGVIGSGRRDDFTTVREAAAEIGIHQTTLKRWLRENTVPGVVWGRDSRGWILVEQFSISKLRNYNNRVHIEGR